MKDNKALLTILLIIFVDILGFSVMIPLLPFYAQSLGASPLAIGFIASFYGIASLIAGPILGDLSDKYGRKPVLLLSQIGTFLSFILLALSHNIFLVFVARVLDGFTSGNITVAQAYISDVTKPEERTKAMGLIGAAFGLGFILGPAISGALAQYGHQAPIWASAFLSLLSIIGTIFTLKDQHNFDRVKEKVNLKKYLEVSLKFELKDYFISFFIFSLMFSVYMSGLALYCERTLIYKGRPFGPKEVGYLLSYAGFASLIVQLGIVEPMVKKWGEVKVMIIGFITCALAFSVISGQTATTIFVAGLTLNVFGNSVLRPSISASISKKANRDEQGLVFGISQTLMSFATIVAPPFSGYLIEHGLNTTWCYSIVFFSLLGILFGFKCHFKQSHHNQVVESEG